MNTVIFEKYWKSQIPDQSRIPRKISQYYSFDGNLLRTLSQNLSKQKKLQNTEPKQNNENKNFSLSDFLSYFKNVFTTLKSLK